MNLRANGASLADAFSSLRCPRDAAKRERWAAKGNAA
jgi:hypothetical protein